MKIRFVTTTVLLIAVAAGGAALYAQDGPPPPPPGDAAGAPPPDAAPGGLEHGMDPAKRLARMTKRYKLTADQQAQIRPLLDDERAQMQALRADASGDWAEHFSKMQAVRATTDGKIEAVLNEQQKDAYEKDQARMRNRMHHSPGDMPPPDGAGGPPPPGD